MRYDEFLADYDQVYDDWAMGKVPEEDAERQIARLRGLIPQIDEVDRRDWGEHLLRRWESEASGPARDRRRRARAAMARANLAEGTEDERLVKYRQGIADITSIADETEDEEEQLAIIGMTKVLWMLIDAIEYDRQHPAEP